MRELESITRSKAVSRFPAQAGECKIDLSDTFKQGDSRAQSKVITKSRLQTLYRWELDSTCRLTVASK